MTVIQGTTSWMAGTTAPSVNIPSAREPSGFDLFMAGLERVATDLVMAGSRQPRQQGGGNVADTPVDSAGVPRLAPPVPYQPAISLEQEMAKAEGSRRQFDAAVINDKVNDGYQSMTQRVNKYVDAELRSINDFDKASKELTEKLGKWYYRAIQWASENLGPIFPYVGLAIAGAMTVATGGAAWPLLALAVMNVANQVLKKNGIDVIAKTESAIGKMGPIIGQENAKALGKRTAAALGVLVSDPTPIGKLFSSLFAELAKMLGASKSVIEACELVGQILGAVVIGVVGLVAGGGGAGLANAMTSAASAVRAAVTAPVATAEAMAKAAVAAVKQLLDMIVASARNLAENGVQAMTSAVKEMIDAVVTAVRELINALREAVPRIKEAATSFFSGSKGMTMPKIGDAVSFMPSLKDLQGMTATYGVNMARAATTGTQATVGGASAGRDFDLAFTQKYIDDTEVDRNKSTQVLNVVRQEMEVTDQAVQRGLTTVAENGKAGADMVREYSQGALQRAQLQSEQMTA